MKIHSESTFGRRYKSIILFIICIAFYLFFYAIDGVIICVDSPSYIRQYIFREPVYPSYLALMRMIFGPSEDIYLSYAVFFQCLLTGFSTYIFIRFIGNRFKLKFWETGFITLICLGVSLICRFLAGRGSMYSNCIMTESICIPLFLLFTRFITEYLLDHKRKALIWALAVSLILVSTRKQMFITLILIPCVIIYVCIKKGNASFIKNLLRGSLTSLVLVCLILKSNKGIEYIYSYSLREQVSSHFNDNRFLTTVIFYTAERDDASLIDDPDLRSLFLDIYDLCDDEGSMMHSAKGGPLARADHFADHYDMIQIDHMWPIFEYYASDKLNDPDPVIRESYVDEISRKIAMSILPKRIPRMDLVLGCNVAKGLCNTVAKSGIVFVPFVIIIYLIYIWAMVFLKKKAENRAADPEIMFGSYSLLSVLINVLTVSVVIFPQVRYTIYNMPVFYTALFVMIIKVKEELYGKKENSVDQSDAASGRI